MTGVGLEGVIGPAITAAGALGAMALSVWGGMRLQHRKERLQADKSRHAQFNEMRADQLRLRMKLAECEQSRDDCARRCMLAEPELSRLRMGMK